MEVTWGVAIVAGLAALVGATVQGGIGFGMNLVTVPALALVLPEALPATVVLIGTPLAADMVRHEHHAVDRPGLLWILLLSLLTLAISATVKRRILAQATLVGFFFILAAFGAIVNGILGTSYGSMLALSEVIQHIWAGLFGVDALTTQPLSLPAAWLAAALYAGLCLGQLARKVRAHEVVA